MEREGKTLPELQTPLRKTALNAVHRAAKAKMVDFGGWDMPVDCCGLTAEHMAVRTGVGVFDVSHMGDIQFRGPGSLAAIQKLCMNDASKLQVGQAQYSAMLYPNGTFVDDVVVHKLSENDYLIVINAGTREKDVQWIRQVIGGMPGVHMNDFSDYYTQLAIQGPKAQETLQKLTPVDLSKIKNYWFSWGQVCGLHNVMIARTGYTGEDGFEIYIPSDEPTSARVWNEVLEAGKEFGILPCGLGSRNTLRLEAAMALYGHEISDEINVFEAGLERYAKFDKGDFVGHDALVKIQEEGGPKRKLVGLEMVERGIGRDGYPVFSLDGKRIGEITSGSPAPFLKKNIALAFVPVEFTAIDTEVAVEIRGQLVKAKVVPTPFYKRPKKQS
ncbi:glycine cleavage system aminomethyltransferase GcvT [Edaphobacter sp. 12200R-103]|uniref:glycine cleavage system aminomethyltransferase GcvT n=1 Tax=Edaphobacter sp. 12200R-103 TaxID=2703788 RepID=UPI00138BAE97|nr:glycine cleavage system aminomethyltransferase GcvT [Edaphobacter sp. 12200R-103]QHS51977.1 glycine cleavage system aminomethyltransferase GcvT [Edaphobacter sp. 12200R-103]